QVLIEKSVLTNKKRTTAYYAHPYSSWERGSNENTNKIIRRFVPKGSNIGNYSKKAIKQIEQWINNYPRKILGYQTASEVYEAA
ncbi:MAG: IS30 family transposase, partial [Eubacteriaceae bacterium]|nr:IS30 family transposase [Eubacteriaceae bacterium]